MVAVCIACLLRIKGNVKMSEPYCLPQSMVVLKEWMNKRKMMSFIISITSKPYMFENADVGCGEGGNASVPVSWEGDLRS